jgi:hypothetical protein
LALLLELTQLVFEVGFADVVFDGPVSLVLIRVLIDEVIVRIFFIAFESFAFVLIKGGTDADTPTGPVIFAMLGEKQPRLLLLIFFGFVGDPAAFEWGDINWRPVSGCLQARSTEGHAVNEVSAVGRDLVPSA